MLSVRKYFQTFLARVEYFSAQKCAIQTIGAKLPLPFGASGLHLIHSCLSRPTHHLKWQWFTHFSTTMQQSPHWLQPNLIHPSLDLPHSPPQMASGSIQPFFHSTLSEHLDRHTDQQDKQQVYSNSAYALLIVSDVLIMTRCWPFTDNGKEYLYMWLSISIIVHLFACIYCIVSKECSCAGLSDFQYLLADRELNGTYKAINDQVYLTDLHSRRWINEATPLCLLPPMFSRFDDPVMYCYREPPAHRPEYAKTLPKLDPDIIGACMLSFCDYFFSWKVHVDKLFSIWLKFCHLLY